MRSHRNSERRESLDAAMICFAVLTSGSHGNLGSSKDQSLYPSSGAEHIWNVRLRAFLFNEGDEVKKIPAPWKSFN